MRAQRDAICRVNKKVGPYSRGYQVMNKRGNIAALRAAVIELLAERILSD